MKRAEPQDLLDLFVYYQDTDYSEFFRRIPGNLNREEFLNIEKLTQSTFYVMPGGFASLSNIDSYGMSCQVGFVLDKKHWDKDIEGVKIAFIMTKTFLEYLFTNTQINKVSMRFLKYREDIEHSLQKGGLEKEGEFKDSVFFQGSFVDELEYSILKDKFFRLYANSVVELKKVGT